MTSGSFKPENCVDGAHEGLRCPVANPDWLGCPVRLATFGPCEGFERRCVASEKKAEALLNVNVTIGNNIEIAF